MRLGLYFDLLADCMVSQIVTQLLQSCDPIIGYAFYSCAMFRMVEGPGKDLTRTPQVLASLQYVRFGYPHLLVAHLEE